MEAFRQLCERVQQAGLTIKQSKRGVGYSSVTFFGHQIGQSTIGPITPLTDKIQRARRPEIKKQEGSSFSLAEYYRDLIPHYAAIPHPPTKKNLSRKVKWEPQHESDFAKMKQCLSSSHILKAVHLWTTFIVPTDVLEPFYCNIMEQPFIQFHMRAENYSREM